MATVTATKWNPFGVELDISATDVAVQRTSATSYKVQIKATWKTSSSNNRTDYGMIVTSGGGSKELNEDGVKASSGSGGFFGSYSISGNGSATKSIAVKFRNYNTFWGDSATKTLYLPVSVPAWTSYMVSYNLNGGSGTFTSQIKWKNQSLTLHSHKPTKTGHTFKGWASTASSTTPSYQPGGIYTGNAALTLTAIWEPYTYPVIYNANGGKGAPASQTKTYGVTLKLSSTKPTRDDYAFKGWSLSSTSTTVKFKAGDNYATNGSLTLYAVWESSYIKPVINNFTVSRGSVNSETDVWESSDNGTSARVTFDWSTFNEVKSITIACESATHKVGPISISATGTSGSVDRIINEDVLSAESTYNVKVSIADGTGVTHTSSLTKTLSGMKFVIDFLNGGKGAAIGKPAESDNTFDIAFKTKLSGGLSYPKLGSCNLNELTTPNIYASTDDPEDYTCGGKSIPVEAGSFTLEVIDIGIHGDMLQRITVYDGINTNVYERVYYVGDDEWTEWSGVWIDAELKQEFAVYGDLDDNQHNQPKYRKDGRVVEIRGVVAPTKSLDYNSMSWYTIFELPNNYRPDAPVYTLCQGSNNRIWLMRIHNDGRVQFSRYRNGDANATADPVTADSSGTWLPFHCTFLAG